MKKEFKGTLQNCKVETVKTDGEITEIYIVKESGGCVICVNDGDDNYDIEGDLANAHLIAAAPDLLEALQNIIDSGDLSKYTESQKTNIERARSAINKALNFNP